MNLIRLLPLLAFFAVNAVAQEAGSPAPAAASPDATTQAAAAVASGYATPRTPDFVEQLVDAVLEIFDIRSTENTITHYIIAALFLLGAVLLRRVVTNLVFRWLRLLSARTRSTLDDKLLPALEGPVATFIMLLGVFAALRVLKLSASADEAVGHGSTVAFSLVTFWGFLRAFGALLDHVRDITTHKQMAVAAFMPWIKRTVLTIFVIFGALMVAQSLGFDVKAVLAGLGIGGLAFALAAQDTLANVFGSVVVAVDQPFKIGETIRISNNVGTVEDIGLRSTKLRMSDKSLMVIPNKTVAAEAIVNLSRFTGRRVEQTLALTYGTTAEQMEELVTELRRLIMAESDVDPDSVSCYFRDYNASSLDVVVAFNVIDADFHKHMQLRQRLNLAFMRAITARGLSFAFPTQTLHVTMPEKMPGAPMGVS